MISSVYSITHEETGRQYIGVTSRDPAVRWNEHTYDAEHARTGMHIHRALKKYGREAFVFKVLATLPTLEEAKIAEMVLIAISRPAFNITSGGDGTRGRVKSPAEREKIGAGRRGKPCSAETRAKISASVSKAMQGNRYAKGVKHSAETRAKLSAKRVGFKHTVESRAKMSEQKKLAQSSPEFRAKMSAAVKAGQARKAALKAPTPT